jgi:nucleotide-binding universal stress UspA family protein
MDHGITDHAMTCKSLSGAMTLRHDIIKDTVRRIANRAGIATSVEPELRPLRGVQTAALNNRPLSRGDVLLVLPDALTVTDISVVHPAAPTYVAGAAQTDGSAAAARDQLKRARYETEDPAAYAFTPFSVETYGRLGKPAMELLNTLATAATRGGADFKGDFVTNALKEISVGLCRGNAILYRRSLYVLARTSGNAFRAGMDVPTADVP